MFFILFSIFCLSIASAQRITPGQCQKRPIVQDFDLKKYVSQTWYEQLRYEAAFQKGCNCSRAIYTLNDDNTVTVKNCCRKPEGNECAIGKAILSEPDHVPLEGKLNVAFNNQPINKSNYWILSTDYEKYSVVYFCTNLPKSMKLEFAWILSATPQLDASVSTAVNRFVDKYFDRSGFLDVDQSDSFCNPRD